MIKLLFLISCLLLSYISFATDLENTSFKQISTEHGLSQKTIQSIFQDHSGFLWFGTQEGLNRYDGREIRIYHHSTQDSNSLSHDVIRAIASDIKGNVWVATSGGLNRYNASNESFKRFDLKTADGRSVTRLNTLFLDSKGTLWIGSEDGGMFFIEGSEQLMDIKHYAQIAHLESADIRTIFEDSRGRLWIGTDDHGITLVNDLEVIEFIPDDKNPRSISHQRIRSIVEDSRGKIWIGTRGGGLNRYDEISKSFTIFRADEKDQQSLSHDRVYQIFEDKRRNLWIATDGGISVYQPEVEKFIQIKHKSSQPLSLSHNRVLSIYEDTGGMLWFGTLSGVNQWNPNIANFSHYRRVIEDNFSINNNTIYAFAESPSSDILIGTFGGGLNILEVENNRVKPLYSQNKPASTLSRITSLMFDREQNLWIGSISEGIEVLSPSLQPIARFEHDPTVPESISANGITDIFQDSDGTIWVATYGGGLNQYIESENQFKRFKKSSEMETALNNDNLFHLMEDDDGYIWISSDGGGISKFDKHSKTFTSVVHDVSNKSALSGNNILSIFQDSLGRFWIGTQGNGLNRWEPEDRRKKIDRFQHYSVENGLNSSTVYGVLEDKAGYLWITTTKGLNKLNPETNQIEHYNLADEIHFNEFNQGAYLKAKNGQFYFGGTNGVTSFNPLEIARNNHVPKVVLTKISSENRTLLFDQPLHSLKQVTFDHKDYLIAFQFAALDFAQPSKNRYQYKLEGFDSEWIDGGLLNRATFTNLPGGTYQLKVKGSNNDGVWSEESINLEVNVLPAPWVSWWAISLYGMGFCGLLILMIRSQAKRLANQEVFRTLVSEGVAKKTELYNKNIDYLNAQLEQFKSRSNVDIETGIANQKYLYDFAGMFTQWINSQPKINATPQFCVAFMRLPLLNNLVIQPQEIYSRVIKKFSQSIMASDAEFQLVVRWNSRDIGLMINANDGAQVNQRLANYLDELTDALEIVTEQDKQLEIKMAFVLLPLEGVSQRFINGERLLMLNEHLLHLVEKEQAISHVGAIKLNQLLNTTNFKQILAANQLSELEDVFDFYRT